MEPSTGEILTMMLNYLVGISIFSIAAFVVIVIAIGLLSVLIAVSDCVPDFDDEEEL